MVKSTRTHKESEANLSLIERIKAIKAEHPAWGYRLVHAYIRYHDKININRKRVYRLMKVNNLIVPKNQRLKATRTNNKHKPRTVEPNSIWGTDMTKVMLPSIGWVYLHIVIDWGSKKIVGYNASLRSKTSDWLDALNKAINSQFPQGIRETLGHESLLLVSDHGCQPTSISYSKECKNLGINHIFASYGNPKGNADTERVMKTIKYDLIYPREFKSLHDFYNQLDKWINQYNTEFPHSSIGYIPPYEYEQWYLNCSTKVG